MKDEYDQLKLDNQLCFPLYAAARKVVALYTPLLKPLGLTYTQYIILMVLWEKGETTIKELGKKLHLDTGTLTPVLKRMEADGHVTRQRSSTDERVVNVSITDKGMSLREKAKDVPSQIGACVPLSEKDARELYRLLYLVIEA
jgi:Transcriptional regulators